MGKAIFRFYEELNDHLPPDRRKRDFEVSFQGKKTVQQVLDTLGVPSGEVDLLLINSRSAGLEDRVRDGDRISVYPVFERLNVQGVSRVRDKPLRNLTFIVDKDLGALAESLQALGLEVCFRRDLATEEILRPAGKQGRILLTRQRHLAESYGMDRVIVLMSGSLHEQLHEVRDALDLENLWRYERAHGRSKPRRRPKD